MMIRFCIASQVFVVLAVLSCVGLPQHARAGDAPAAAAADSRNDIYLFIGQSNMAGRVNPRPTDTIPNDKVKILNDKEQLVPMPGRRRLNEYSTIRKSAARMGPGYFVVQRLIEQRPERMVCVVANARGGSSINQWAKGEHYFDEAVRRTREAMKHGTLRGICWHQGETDYRMPEGEYLVKLKQFVNDLRDALGTPDVPFIAGQITRNTKGTERINAEIAQLAEAVPNCFVASSEGLVTVDQWHFDRKSIEQLGNRYADHLLAALASPSPKPALNE